jgi:dynein regulatory complex subunit 2
MLDRDLDEAEEQYQMALRNHLIHIDDLINLQNSRLRGLHEEFENDVKMIKLEYDREREDIERNHYMETRELREMILTIEEEENAKLKEMQDQHDGLREETKNKNVEELESMKHELIKQIEKLDKDFEQHF